MENEEISSDEFREARSSESAQPLLIDEAINPLITSYLHDITEQQWELLAGAHTNTDTVRLLSGLCLNVVDKITTILHNNFVPLVRSRMRELMSSNTSITMNGTDAPETDWSCFLVPEEAIQLCIGDTLHRCLGEWMGVVEESSYNSDKLLELIAAEVTRRVNRKVAVQSPSLSQSHLCTGSDMAYHTAQILHRCFRRRYQLEESSQGCDFEVARPKKVTEVEEFDADNGESFCSSFESSVPSWFYGPEKDIEELIYDKITVLIASYLTLMTDEHLELLAADHPHADIIRLFSGLCLRMVKKITSMVLDDMLLLVHTKMRELVSSNTLITMNGTDAPQIDLRCVLVAEKGIQLCIGDTLHRCLGEWMGVVEERSHNSDKLLELVAAEVTRRVNHSVAAIIQSPSLSQSTLCAGSDITCQSLMVDMGCHTAQIMHRCYRKKQQIQEDLLDKPIIGWTGHPILMSEFSSPDEVTDVEEFSAEDADSICSPSEGSVPSIIDASPSPAVDVSQRENSSGQKSTGGTSSFVKKVRKFFWRNTARVAPACEVIQLENGSTPQSPKKKKHPAITRMFSSLARILRKPFTSCISGRSQDD